MQINKDLFAKKYLSMRQALKKQNSYPCLLYSKNPRDAVIIFGIVNHYDPAQINALLFEKGLEVLQ